MRTLVLTALGVAIVAAGAAAGQLHAATIAETSIGDRGTFLFAGQATFPIALSNPPPIDGLTPAGTDGLDVAEQWPASAYCRYRRVHRVEPRALRNLCCYAPTTSGESRKCRRRSTT